MAKKRSGARREAERAIRKNPKLFVILLVIFLIVAVVFGVAVWYLHTHEEPENPGGGSPGVGDIVTDELAIYFIDVGNKYTGDSIYIRCGTTDILIDAGSQQASAKAVGDFVESHSEDKMLDYVIATHADQDHIAGFVGTAAEKGIFERFKVKTVIDFPRTNKDLKTASGNDTLYGKYVAARDAEVEGGAVHYTALDCWKEEKGAKRSYALNEEGTVTMNVLYNYYYENKAADENNYSVCLLFSQGETHYLFTGDLEEKGEEYLVQNNPLPHVKLFKAGHHGSPTSSTEALLRVIQPEYVCVCCCAGSTEYTDTPANTFPSQAMIDRIAPYTKNIFVTALSDESKSSGYAPFNGTITVLSDGTNFSIAGSNNSTVLKETAWFAANRVWPRDGK